VVLNGRPTNYFLSDEAIYSIIYRLEMSQTHVSLIRVLYYYTLQQIRVEIVALKHAKMRFFTLNCPAVTITMSLLNIA
jgi:hypothetical protein